MFSVEFGKIYRIFLIPSVSELFGNSSWINFFRAGRLIHPGSSNFLPGDGEEEEEEEIFRLKLIKADL